MMCVYKNFNANMKHIRKDSFIGVEGLEKQSAFLGMKNCLKVENKQRCQLSVDTAEDQNIGLEKRSYYVVLKIKKT